ncbi:MAG: NAD-glutamate dehydrogenase, partial [Propionibacteriaceae bacterium]|nr:NAD-glutamate dehydrogenase [Propionibacteriaceae bacterium]
MVDSELVAAVKSLGAGRGQWDAFAAAYLGHGVEEPSSDPRSLANQLAAHWELGSRRPDGADCVAVATPDGENPPLTRIAGSTRLQLVTGDKRFLVDTISMEVRRLGWEVRLLDHPQFRVVRDDAGNLLGLDDEDGSRESWLSLEVYPPLGESARELAGSLKQGVLDALGVVRGVNRDYPAMLARCQEAVEELSRHGSDEARAGAELLRWLADGHFAFFGSADYDAAAVPFAVRAGSELGVLQDGALDFDARPAHQPPNLFVMTKHPQRSTLSRPSYLDYVGVRRLDADGRLVGERRFLGLLTTRAYSESVDHIPSLAAKAQELLVRSGFEPGTYSWNALWQAIATYPRDELFDARVEELSPILESVAHLRDRRLVRVFPRRDHYGAFVTVQVYLPRDRYNTASRERLERILLEAYGGESLEFTATTNSAVLTRLFFVIKLGPQPVAEVDEESLAGRLEEATLTWDERVVEALASFPSEQRGVEFGEAYQAAYTPQQAVADLRLANTMDGDALRYSLTPVADDDWRLKIFSRRELELHTVLPHLANLGAEVFDEQPFELSLRGRPLWVLDFGLRLPKPPGLDEAVGEQRIRSLLVPAFDASYSGRCEADGFNRLVLAAGLPWQRVVWLRAVAAYLKQARLGFSLDYIAGVLAQNPALAAGLVEALEARFASEAEWSAVRERLEAGIEAVASLDADRILRACLAFVSACLRTNAFGDGALSADAGTAGGATTSGAAEASADTGRALAFKLDPTELAFLPQPRPWAEIFVYSPRVQGVHLRFGPVARGGLRWSDRAEDFRTEVLGLVKAQMVKNAVIVPVGAKGGFVATRLPDPSVDRAAWQAEGVACYQMFVRALLSVTDNIVEGRVVAPCPRRDGDDPYLVVAADKGTAAFSDIANQLAVEEGFWLGDAFASGGSAGYDHKAMGITARGAWESTKRHFAEMGLDPAVDDFTCVGIGDMSGDVFGNGMLCSPHIRLVAAFDHRHIFVDPDPDAAASFAERQRLFGLARSSWDDYDRAAISAGGGVYPRSAKRIPLSAQARRALGVEGGGKTVTGAELVGAILRAPVDLLYNGGVGTYVKASSESHGQVGDKANDAVRVDGREVRARCAVEGGNLGWTQAGRVEYALAGGRINTDFIDNSAGVDTSDHEVNIKILLAHADVGERDRLLVETTDEVAEAVLRHNVDQNLALSNAEAQAREMLGAHIVWMKELEAAAVLDRALEGLPDDKEVARRQAAGLGLTRPELAVLLSYTKIALTDQVLASDLPDDPYLADRLTTYFPKPLRERFAAQMPGHRLAREIVTTVAVNRFVDSQGILAAQQLRMSTGAQIADVIRAQLAARAIYTVGASEIELGRSVGLGAEVATAMRLELRRMVERSARWLLHNRRAPLDVVAAVAQYREPVAALREVLPGLLSELHLSRVNAKREAWLAAGAPQALAERLSVAAFSHLALAVSDLAAREGADPVAVAGEYAALGEALGLDAMEDAIYRLPRQTRWESMARAALRDDLLAIQGQLTAQALREGGAAAWLASRERSCDASQAAAPPSRKAWAVSWPWMASRSSRKAALAIDS